MKLEEFEIGKTFYGSGGFQWLCTDKGTRTITAIMLDPDKEDYWFKGPPYSVEEQVFDEYEIKILYSEHEDFLLDTMDNCEASSHPNFLGEDVFKMVREKDRSYPNKKLLTRDRVNKEGHILHPYSGTKKDGIGYIKVFELFSRTYSEVPENEFVQLSFATEEDMKKRKNSIQIT